MAWQAHRREDDTEAVPYFEKLLLHFKSLPEPNEEVLRDIQMMTKAVIRYIYTRHPHPHPRCHPHLLRDYTGY